MISPILELVVAADFNSMKLIWRPKPHTLRLVVGTLRREGEGFSFLYDGPDFARAEVEGFAGYPGMSDYSKEYNGQAMNSFASRIPSRERPDIDRILAAWGADVDMTDFQILGLTAGSLPTDMFELIPEIPATTGQFFYTSLAGIQQYAKSEVFRTIPLDTNLVVQCDPENEYDCNAVSVRYDGHIVAYIKRVHCESVGQAIQNGIEVKCELARVRLNGVINEVIVKISYT